MCNNDNTSQITDINTLQCITQVTQRHAYHQHAEQWSSHHTIRLRFWPDTPAEIWPQTYAARFRKFESGTSLTVSDVLITFYLFTVIRAISSLNFVFFTNKVYKVTSKSSQVK